MSFHVLIVDDEMLIREGLRKHLPWDELNVDSVETADCAERALQQALSHPPDLLITDICMRGKNGFDLIEDLIEAGLSPATILISSYNDFQYAQRAVRLSVVKDYILKPIDTQHLSCLIAKLIHSQGLSNPAQDSQKNYCEFLSLLRCKQYDRHILIRSLCSGNSQTWMEQLNIIRQVSLQSSVSFSVLQKFYTGLVMAAAAQGALSHTLEHNDPTDALLNCENCRQLHAAISQLFQSCVCNDKIIAEEGYSKLIAACLESIDRNFCSANFNLTALAGELGVTPNYLSIRFKEETGIGFMKYLTDKQIQQAMLLLADPRKKIYEIALMVGYHDEKYFSKLFKKYTGYTPKDYRNKHTSPV